MHVRMIIAASPQKHKELIRSMQSRKYPYEGQFRRGWSTPNVTQVIPYDIRLKKEVAPQFCKDYVTNDFGADWNSNENTDHHLVFPKLLRHLTKWFRKLTRHDVPQYTHLNRTVDLKGWHYGILIGTFPDPEHRKGNEEL